MPSNTTRVERTCLVCSNTFDGTPKAVRCPSCRSAGLRVKATNPNHERSCVICEASFKGRSDAVRCPRCVSDGKPIPASHRPRRKRRFKCLECGKSAYVDPNDPTSRFCGPCDELISTYGSQRSLEELELERQAQRLAMTRERLKSQRKLIDSFVSIPEGTRMSPKTAKLPIGILWLQIVHQDGAAAASAYTPDTDLAEDQFLTLVVTYHRLRCKGYEPYEIASLCPSALLKRAAQDAISSLPVLTSESDDRSFPVAFTEEQERQAHATALGINASTSPIFHN